jgi:ABC-2 type transport system permease protein
MRVYFEVARRSFQRFSTYRAAVVAGVFTNTVFGFILASVLRTALGTRSVGGLTAETATAFTFLAQAMLMIVMVFGDFDEVEKVRTGEVATALTRPLDYSLFRLASDLGRSTFNSLARGIPPFVVGWLVYRFPLAAPLRFASFLLAVVLAAVVASRWWNIVSTLAFWMTDGSGAMQMGVAVCTFATGAIIPLQFLPDGLKAVVQVTPWAAMVQRPVEVFIGLGSVWSCVAVQLVWIAVLESLLRLELRFARRKLVIQGG